MDVPVYGIALFVQNKNFDTSMWKVSDVYLLSFSQSSTITNIFRGATLDLVTLALGCEFSKKYRIYLM